MLRLRLRSGAATGNEGGDAKGGCLPPPFAVSLSLTASDRQDSTPGALALIGLAWTPDAAPPRTEIGLMARYHLCEQPPSRRGGRLGLQSDRGIDRSVQSPPPAAMPGRLLVLLRVCPSGGVPCLAAGAEQANAAARQKGKDSGSKRRVR